MTTRRQFITLIGGAPAAWPVVARAQQGNQTRRIGVMAGNADTPENRSNVVALRKALLELGWSEDRNVRLDIRWPGPNPQHIQRETSDLIATNPAVVVSGTSIAIAQILRTSPTTAVVFAGITDPVGQGFVTSLARPGGNATGFAAYEVSLGGKWVETLKEMSPTLIRAAIVYEPINAPYMGGMVRSMAAATASTGVEVIDMAVGNVSELENAIANLGQQANSGLIVPPAGFTLNNFALILALAAKYRLPAIYAFRTIERRIYGSEKFRSAVQKDFCNTICQ